MNHRVIFAEEMLKVIRERLKSREWWFWIPVGPDGARGLQKIERALYWGDANNDFDLAFFPARMLFVAMGKKTRATPEQIEKTMTEVLTRPVHVTDETDVMILAAGDDTQGQLAGLMAVAFISGTKMPGLN